MNFIEATKANKENAVEVNYIDYVGEPCKMVLKKGEMEGRLYSIKEFNYDWKIVEEKKTLWDKATNNIGDITTHQFWENDVQEALNEFLAWMTLVCNERGITTKSVIKSKAKEIFGDRLIED